MAQELLKTGQVALMLGVNPKTVDRWGKELHLLGEPVAVGKQVRYRRDAVLAFEADRKAEAAEKAELTERAKAALS